MSIKSFANGVVVGLILGVLFAPDSGDETRKKIAKKACDLKDTVADKYDDIASTVADQYGRVKSKANELMGKGEKMAGDVKNDAANMFE
jgi:gas vesicle protein